MTPLEAVAVAVAGVAAGAINAVVGSGTLITFSTLLAIGFDPLVANVSNNIGLVPGSASAAIGFRDQLEGQGGRVRRLAVASASGGLIGAVLLLTLPSSVFDAVVPILIVLACGLVLIQPRVNAWLTFRRPDRPHHGGPWLLAGVFATGIYGGYFGAGQGIVLIAALGILLTEPLVRVNAIKNVLAGIVNLLASVVFVFGADVAWDVVALLAVGSIVGGHFGARVGRRLPPNVIRALIVVIGLTAAIKLWLD
jgi:uncharacterized protein